VWFESGEIDSNSKERFEAAKAIVPQSFLLIMISWAAAACQGQAATLWQQS